MSFPRYERYKDSGVEWLGEVPEHWRILRLRNVARIENGFDYKPLEVFEGGYPVFGSGGKFARVERPLYSGPSVLLGRKGTIDKPLYVDEPFWTVDTSFYTVIEQGTSPRFFYYFCLCLPFAMYANGTALPSMTQTVLYNVPAVVPPREEQDAGAIFLDHETAKIDALINEQQRLIALLKEKRQAVISHAITKGLDPSVPMKESRVKWLGNVPENWKVMPICRAAKLESGHTPSRTRPDYWENCIYPWFTLADIWQIREAGRSTISDTAEKVSEYGLANSSARLLPAGTVMLSRTASVGFAAMMAVDMATSQDFANWICGREMLPRFLLWVFRGMRHEFDRLMIGSTHKTIYMPDIRSLQLALPTLQEQQKIDEFLTREEERISSCRIAAEKSITLLQERRAALISAAVTGKIDVRNYAPRETSPAPEELYEPA